VGQRIREAREKQKISQDQLALRSGLHRSYVGQIERGETNILVATLHKIGVALGVPMADILRNVG
jgi:transcriptional regulator with XRE-family HTH domain